MSEQQPLVNIPTEDGMKMFERCFVKAEKDEYNNFNVYILTSPFSINGKVFTHPSLFGAIQNAITWLDQNLRR